MPRLAIEEETKRVKKQRNRREMQIINVISWTSIRHVGFRTQKATDRKDWTNQPILPSPEETKEKQPNRPSRMMHNDSTSARANHGRDGRGGEAPA